MTIRREDVLHVAQLARLRLHPDEVDRLARDVGRILEHVESLARVEVRADGEPTALAGERLPLRADEPRPGLDPGAALAEAPRTASGGFAVPAFVDDA